MSDPIPLPTEPETKDVEVTALRMLRIENDLTQQDLADAVGVARSHIQRLEDGVNEPTVSLAMRIARALRVSIYELWTPD